MTATLIYAKNIHSILEIGFGGGRTSWYLHRFLPDVSVTSVELDPDRRGASARNISASSDEPNFHLVNQDGRIFLKNSKDKYDIILIDAYRGPFVPFHLLTKEFYQIVKDHLADGGVVAQNVEPTTMLFDSAVKTIHAVFPQEDFYLAEGNVVTIAYDGPPRPPDELEKSASDRDAAFHLRYSLDQMLAQRRRLPPDDVGGTIDPNAKVLTDDFAPVEVLEGDREPQSQMAGQVSQRQAGPPPARGDLRQRVSRRRGADGLRDARQPLSLSLFRRRHRHLGGIDLDRSCRAHYRLFRRRRFVDRHPTPRVIVGACAFAALYLALVPGAADPMMEGILDRMGGGPAGILIAASALLLVPLSFLGTFSPVAVRLMLRSTAQTGRIAGLVYGISTIGNIFGTLFTTFVLIPTIGSREITYLYAAVLAVSALSMALASRTDRAA